ncbi:PucR family transcriptional regulator ligand-binding domain-containing protein [Actinomadura gamaensis]|uniref:PucR family transcriptional regulator ligand-binding domain-containing protein n=1 Tax=Actinomadura gamaensis TaxID=1763541 RepID=UPI003A8F7ECC
MSDIRVEAGPPAHRFASTGTLTRGLPVGEVLEVSALRGARLIAGRAGLGRVVQRLNVMEVPDILPWVKPNELLLTTGYPLRGTPGGLPDLVGGLDERGVAALAIKPGRYLAEPPPEMIEQADRRGFPLILLPADVAFDDVLNQVLTDILNRQAAVLARTEEVHRALVQTVLCGGGLREVVDEVAAHLGAVVAVLDGERRVLAASGTEEQVRAVRAVALRGDAAIVAEGDHVVVPVVAGGFDHGRLIAHRPDGALGEGALGILERAATVAALVLTKQQAVAAVESKYRADFLRDILAGRAGDDDRVIAHCSGFGWDLDRPVLVIVAELDGRPRPAEPEQASQGRPTRPVSGDPRARARSAPAKPELHSDLASAVTPRPGTSRKPDAARAALGEVPAASEMARVDAYADLTSASDASAAVYTSDTRVPVEVTGGTVRRASTVRGRADEEPNTIARTALETNIPAASETNESAAELAGRTAKGRANDTNTSARSAEAIETGQPTHKATEAPASAQTSRAANGTHDDAGRAGRRPAEASALGRPSDADNPGHPGDAGGASYGASGAGGPVRGMGDVNIPARGAGDSGRGAGDAGGPGRGGAEVAGSGRGVGEMGAAGRGTAEGAGRRGVSGARGAGRPSGGGVRGGRGAEERAAQERLAAAWAAAVRRHDRGAAVASFAHEVVAVVGADGDDPDMDGGPVHTLVKEATALFAEHSSVRRTFSTGISRTVMSPSRLPEAYEQALKSVRVGRQLHGDGARAHFDQLGVYRLLSLVPDPEELHAFVRETLGDLAADDEPELVDLRRTLQVLLETNLNVAETARRLHFHYNTLRYRIGKLERLLGPFTEDAHLRLNLTLALHVLRMRGI